LGRRKIKAIFVGDSECGKTALLSAFVKNNFPEVNLSLRLFWSVEFLWLLIIPVNRLTSSLMDGLFTIMFLCISFTCKF
jgi:GTPase SAR1 family protein